MNITPEVIEALRWLRNGWDGDNSERAITCFTTLDDAGVFAAIDEVVDFGRYTFDEAWNEARLKFGEWWK